MCPTGGEQNYCAIVNIKQVSVLFQLTSAQLTSAHLIWQTEPYNFKFDACNLENAMMAQEMSLLPGQH